MITIPVGGNMVPEEKSDLDHTPIEMEEGVTPKKDDKSFFEEYSTTMRALDGRIIEDLRLFLEEDKESQLIRWVYSPGGDIYIDDILPKAEDSKFLNPIKLPSRTIVDLYYEIWRFHPRVVRLIADVINKKVPSEEGLISVIDETKLIISQSHTLKSSIQQGRILFLPTPEQRENIVFHDPFRDETGRIISGNLPRTSYDVIYNEELIEYRENRKAYEEDEESRLIQN